MNVALKHHEWKSISNVMNETVKILQMQACIVIII